MESPPKSTKATDNNENNNTAVKKRKSYAAEFKLYVLKVLETEALSVPQAAERFGTCANNIRDWRNNKEELQKVRNPSKYKLPGGGVKANQELHTALLTWFQDQQARGIRVMDKHISQKALEIAQGIPGLERFKGSNGFIKSFKHRHGIVASAPTYRAHTPTPESESVVPDVIWTH
jgi:transposase-like protein